MTTHLVIYLLAFVGIWIGSGLAIGAVEKISRLLRISSFIVSFLVLGIFTSVGEISVGVNAILAGDPEIYVGNLIGASIVIFMLIIPLLAISGNKINISKEFRGFNLPASLVVIALPVVLSIDGQVTRTDSIIVMVLFVLLVLAVQTKKNLIEHITTLTTKSSIKISKELFRILFGLSVIFIASRFVVSQTINFSEVLGVSPFVVSLLLIAIGTNIPELSFVVRSMFMRSNQVAFGDYVGSAAFNSFLLGLLTVINGRPVYLTNSYLISLIFLIVGLVMFYNFARSKHSISRWEGAILLMLYVLFLTVEILTH